MTWNITIAFILFATLLTMLVGWLTTTRKVPIQLKLVFSEAGSRFMRVWIVFAIVIGIVLPIVAWIVWRNSPQPHHFLSLYLATLLIQIVTEQIAGSIGISSLVVPIGTIYTLFRLWQLWQGQPLMNAAIETNSLLIGLWWLLSLFWFSNLIMLSTLGWSSVLHPVQELRNSD